MGKSLRVPIVLLLTVALAAIVISQLVSTLLVESTVSDAAAKQVVPVLWFNFFIELAVLTCGFFIAGWLINRDRTDRLAQSRIEHLAEVAVMSGGFAHEARNLIHAMQTRLELLRKNVAGDEKAEDRVNKLDEIASSMEQLLNEFLTIARPADDKLEETDPVGLVGQVLEFEELELERAGVQVIFESSPDVPSAMVDRGKLKRALLNLVVNARQAMPEGGKLHVRVFRRRRRVCIEIQDTGHGIPAEDQRRIFQTYFTTKSGGTGLGLAIVRRTIEDFGGTISFTSALGRGTAFVITLPSIRQQRAPAKRFFQELALKKAAARL